MKIVPMTIGHLIEFRANVREIDLEEVERASGFHFDSFAPFECEALLDDDGTVVAIGGIAPPNIVWMMTTKAVETRRIKFLRFTKNLLTEKLREYGELTNIAYKKNQLHIDWLTWLGAEWFDHDEEFMRFTLRQRKE